jgi:hypothetical protein
MQLDIPPEEYFPCGHVWQLELLLEPFRGEKVPAGQFLQPMDFTASEYDPGVHCLHDDHPTPE